MSAYSPVTQAALGVSPIVVITPWSPNLWPPAQTPFQLGLAATISPGATLTYSVQITCDPSPSNTGNWNNHDVLVNLTASANSNIAYPITGLRLNVTSYTSGTVTLGVARWP